MPLYDSWHWEPPAEEAIGFDPAEATRLLDEAGYVDTDGDGIREMPGGGDPLEWRLFIATTDPAAIKAAPFVEGWLRDIGIDASTKSMTDSKLYDQWYGFDWDLIIYSWGVGPRSGLHPVELHQRAMWLLERHLLREPRVRRALRGAAGGARRTSARRS